MRLLGAAEPGQVVERPPSTSSPRSTPTHEVALAHIMPEQSISSETIFRNREALYMQPGTLPISLRVNGVEHALAVEPRRTLLDALRHDLQLTGAKHVCGMGDCGACTVLVNGKAMYACLMLAVECEGWEIETVEGLANGSELDPVQRAFIEADAFQCGFCTSGQIMSLKGLFNEEPSPSDAAILRAVTGNLCRCGAYRNILEAARRVAREREEGVQDANPAR